MGAVVDHIEPHSSGGQYEDANLVTSCCKCNALKSAAKQEQFRASHPRRAIKGKYGEPEHWDGLSTLLILLVAQNPGAASSLEQRWWHALTSAVITEK
jgi:hypothetical protein